MKKIFKSRIFAFILGAIIFSGITAVSAYTVLANNIGYTPKDKTWKVSNVKDAIDELYSKKNSNSNNIVCMLLSGTKNTVSAKYHCELGDGILRNFYILSIDGNNVKLIMEKNLSDEVGSNTMMTWQDAMDFFKEGHDGYTTKQAWTKVQSIDLPDAQDIANAGGISNFDITTTTTRELYFGGNQNSSGNFAWIYNYLRGCGNYGRCSSSYPDSDGYPWGYWTKNMMINDNDNAWVVNTNGFLDPRPINDAGRGIRPVITLSKSNLAG